MEGESCRLPSRKGDRDTDAVSRMLKGQRIAVVGLSDNSSRPSYDIARYLLSTGREVVPVNPNHSRVMGLTCYASLEAVPGQIDVVNVFRRPEHCAEVVRSAIAIGAKGVWLQSGIVNEEGRELAERAKIDFVQNRCIMVENRWRQGD
jgi:hypothetical protein